MIYEEVKDEKFISNLSGIQGYVIELLSILPFFLSLVIAILLFS